jgi:hypothetical protein
MQPHFFSWLETILKYLNILFTWQPYRHLHPHWGFLSHLPVTCSVKSTLEDNRRCLNQVLFPDTHSRNLIRLDRYSLIVPGRRVPFSSSRSITSPASPTVSSRKILSELSRQTEKNESQWGDYLQCGGPGGTVPSAGDLFPEKKEKKTLLISSLFLHFGSQLNFNWLCNLCSSTVLIWIFSFKEL